MYRGVVARDGIEPPTPAFSGPRSTTELSGLGIKTPCRGSPRTPGRIASATPVAPVCREGNQPFKRFSSIATHAPSPTRRRTPSSIPATLSCCSPCNSKGSSMRFLRFRSHSSSAPHRRSGAEPRRTPSEQRASRAFEAAKKAGAPQLYAFLKPFPKGADLHMHLSGAIYAETFIAEAIKQGLCVSSKRLHPASPIRRQNESLPLAHARRQTHSTTAKLREAGQGACAPAR